MKVLLGIVIGIAVMLGIAWLSDKRGVIGRIATKMVNFSSTNVIFGTYIVIGIIFASFMSIPYSYSNGIKSGSITKFTEKGLIFKTWEGSLNLGGMVANIWHFSVTDEAIVERLKSETGRVSLEYDQKLSVPIYIGSTSYIITNIKETK